MTVPSISSRPHGTITRSPSLNCLLIGSPRIGPKGIDQMVPHQAVHGLGGSIQARQARSGPGDRVGHALGSKDVKLLLVPVGKGIPEAQQIVVVGLVAATLGLVLPRPSRVAVSETLIQVAQAQPF